MKILPQQNVSLPPAMAAKSEVAPSASPKAADAISGDSFHSPLLETLRNSLQAEPEVRMDQVERGRRWASDPDYPPLDILNSIAEMVVKDAARSE